MGFWIRVGLVLGTYCVPFGNTILILILGASERASEHVAFGD